MGRTTQETCEAMESASAAMVAAVIEIERLREDNQRLRQENTSLRAQLARYQEGGRQ